MFRSIALWPVGLVAIALAADTTTIKVLLPADPQALVGSIVNVEDQVTTVAVKCSPDTPSDECGFDSKGVTVTQGPSTWIYTYGIYDEADGPYSQVARCNINSAKDEVSCHVVVTQQISGQTTAQSTDFSTDYSDLLLPVVVTAGADKLASAPTAAATSNSAARDSTAQPKSTPTGSPTSTGTSTPTSTSASTGTNAAGPVATQNVVLAAGVAAVVGGVFGL